MAVLRVLASVSALKEGCGFTVPSVGGSWHTHMQIADCHSYKDNWNTWKHENENGNWLKWGQKYHIAGNFWENSRILQFVAIHDSFLRKILGRAFYWQGKSKQSVKVFSVNIVFFTNSRKFSPSKVSHCTVNKEPGLMISIGHRPY